MQIINQTIPPESKFSYSGQILTLCHKLIARRVWINTQLFIYVSLQSFHFENSGNKYCIKTSYELLREKNDPNVYSIITCFYLILSKMNDPNCWRYYHRT